MGYLGFRKLKSKLSKKGIRNPAALAAKIGKAKYGKKRFQKAAAQGKSMKGMPVYKGKGGGMPKWQGRGE